MRTLFVLASVLLIYQSGFANEEIKMSFENEDLSKIVSFYSKSSGQKFIFSSQLGGKATIINREPVSVEQAFDQLSSALAVNGYAISRQGDTMIIESARNTQRSLLEVSEELPPLKPERMFTWVYNPKFVNAGNIFKHLRVLPSKDGEMVALDSNNQLIFTDWTSNLHRIAALLDKVDRKPSVALSTRNNSTEEKRTKR
ncbi:MAG: general secretion pathway protein GspD [Bdellovibrionales bacterium]|nr:general secretion pathway protein GspD [Bdellovibrionales bacterium]